MSFSVADADAEAQIEYVPYPMKSEKHIGIMNIQIHQAVGE